MKTPSHIFAAATLAATSLLYFPAQAQTNTTTSTASTPFKKAHVLDPTPELLQKSEKQLWDNMRRAFTLDELEAFIRSHPDSENVPVALTRLGQSQQRSINTLQKVLDTLANNPPSTELSKAMGIADAAALQAELRSYLQTHQALLDNIQQRHRNATSKDIDMGAAQTGVYGKVNGDVPSPMFAAPMPPLPYRKGYSWSVRMLDVLTQKTTEYTRTVTQLLPYGYIELNDGASVLDMDGNIRGLLTPASADGRLEGRKRMFNGNYRQHPQSLQRGREHTFGYVITDTMNDGKVFTQQGTNASMTSVAPELIEVSAGKFDTWKVVRRSNWKVTETGNSGTFAMTGWYSPVLRRYVRWEEVSHNATGIVVRHERHELLRTD